MTNTKPEVLNSTHYLLRMNLNTQVWLLMSIGADATLACNNPGLILGPFGIWFGILIASRLQNLLSSAAAFFEQWGGV